MTLLEGHGMEGVVCSPEGVSGRPQLNCCLCPQSRQDDVDRTAAHTGMVLRFVNTVSVDLTAPNSVEKFTPIFLSLHTLS